MAVPGAPTVSFGTVTSSSVYVRVADGANGGLTITNRQIAYSTTFGSVSDFIASTSSTAMTIGNLASSTTWSFRARCYNSSGWGAWGSVGTATTAAAISAPAAPTVSLSSVTQTSVYASVNDGANGGASVTSRQIAYSTTFGSTTDFVATISGTGTTISGLSAGTNWSFRARAYNSAGWSGWGSTASVTTTAPTPTGSVPSAPTVATGEATTNSIFVSVQDGSNNGATITARQLAYSTTVGSVSDFVANMSGTTITVGNLSSGTTYSFRARCYNSFGWGAWGSNVQKATASTAPPPPTATVPDAPIGLATGEATETSIYVSFTDPPNGGSPITGRQIAYSTTFGSVNDFIVSIEAPSAVIGNLTKGTEWSFRARCGNAIGWGGWGSVATGTTLGGTAPVTAPEAPTLFLGSPGPATVPVTMQDGSTGGAQITMRQIGYSTTYGALTFITDVTGTYKLIDNLTPETTWSFRGRSGNSAGWGAWGSVYTATTLPGTVPGAPTSITTGVATKDSIEVSYSDNGDGGSPILERQIGYSTTFGAIEFVATMAGNTFVVKNLTPNTTWSFRARNRNRFGWGGWGSVASGKTVAWVPDAPPPPVITNITRNTVDVQVLVPKSNGGHPILRYQVSHSADPNSSGIWTYTNSQGVLVIDELLMGTTYYIKARAENELGWSGWSETVQVTLKSAVFVSISGVPREAIPYVNVNGVWRKAIPHIRMSGFWRSM